jgi:hypothetical protein
MKPIIRSEGITESERYLSKLADRTFLNLWSYSNTFIDKRSKNGGDGKEFCDLLVVCGDDVVIFSDKSIDWPEHPDLNVSWARWYRRAIGKSVDQIRGAERWLSNFPNRIFIDRACTEPFPFAFPPSDRARVHGIAIALGADSACKKHFGATSGTLPILGLLKGKDHIDPQAKVYMPFALGDVDPDGPFVHVFDKEGLDLVLTELDTISDFTRYLAQRESFIRGGDLGTAPGEAELLGLYLGCANATGEHIFPSASNFGAPEGYSITLVDGDLGVLGTQEHRAKKEADRISYVWDRLIGVFTENILAGTSVAILGEEPSAVRAEPALRIMTRETRLRRRALGHAFSDALRSAEEQRQDRFSRVVVPEKGDRSFDYGYIFLVLAYPTKFELKEGYQQYRRARVAMLEAYCATVLYERRDLRRMVGIALDASSRVTGRSGGSEDLIAFEVDEWSPEFERQVEKSRAQYDILRASRLRTARVHHDEYPSDAQSLGRNRRERRAAEKRARAGLKNRQKP